MTHPRIVTVAEYSLACEVPSIVLELSLDIRPLGVEFILLPLLGLRELVVCHKRIAWLGAGYLSVQVDQRPRYKKKRRRTPLCTFRSSKLPAIQEISHAHAMRRRSRLIRVLRL